MQEGGEHLAYEKPVEDSFDADLRNQEKCEKQPDTDTGAVDEKSRRRFSKPV